MAESQRNAMFRRASWGNTGLAFRLCGSSYAKEFIEGWHHKWPLGGGNRLGFDRKRAPKLAEAHLYVTNAAKNQHRRGNTRRLPFRLGFKRRSNVLELLSKSCYQATPASHDFHF